MILNATLRSNEEAQKNNGMLKAVIYGHGLPTQSIQIQKPDFSRLYREVKYSTLFDVVIDGQPPVKALIHEIQVNPITMEPIHVDFHQIRMDENITVSVPLVFIGESAAVKAMGGTLVKSLDRLDVECLPGKLPKEITIDLSLLVTFEDRITVGSLNLPDVAIKQGTEEVIATVEAPLTDEEIKKMEQAEIGDVTAVKSEADEKKEKETAEATETDKKVEKKAEKK